MDLVVILLVATPVVAAVAWRVASRRASLPCPSWLAWLFESRIGAWLMDARRTLSVLQLTPGMDVLDAGCGSGRVSVEIARAVGVEGTVVAADLQPAMLRAVAQRAEKLGLPNVQTLRAGLGEGSLPRDRFDRAVLVAVLGEIPDRLAALREIKGALRPHGLLAVTEVFPDPHYQSRRGVVRLLESAGFVIVEQDGAWWAHTTVARRGKE